MKGYRKLKPNRVGSYNLRQDTIYRVEIPYPTLFVERPGNMQFVEIRPLIVYEMVKGSKEI